jgi:hypothetical protein
MILRSRNPALEAQYKQQGECCFYCKREIPFVLITKDHIYPRSKGWKFTNNKIFACRTCNNIKGNRTFEEFRDLLKKRCQRIRDEIKSDGFRISDNKIFLLEHHEKVISTVEEIIRSDFKLDIVFT